MDTSETRSDAMTTRAYRQATACPVTAVKAMTRRRGTIKVDMRRKGFVQLGGCSAANFLATETILFLCHTADFTSTIEGAPSGRKPVEQGLQQSHVSTANAPNSHSSQGSVRGDFCVAREMRLSCSSQSICGRWRKKWPRKCEADSSL
jgi:hypothetical protein